MRRSLRTILLLFVVLAAVAGSVLAMDNRFTCEMAPLAAPADGSARVAIVHLAPFSADPAVDVTVDGFPLLSDFAYGESSSYQTVPTGTHTVAIYPAGAATPALTQTVELDAMDYTAIAVGDGVNQDLGLRLLTDDNNAPSAGFAKVRMGHLAPFASGSAAADIRFQDGTPVLTDVAYGTVTPIYVELPAGDYDLKITAPGGGTTLIDPLPFTLTDGDILSAFATGDGVNQDLGVFALPAGVPGGFLPLAKYQWLPLVLRGFGP